MERPEELLHELFCARGWTLALAESCTGGEIISRLTKRAGASHYLLGSVVAYSNRMKEEWLSVSKELLEQYGSVSREVAAAMAEGVRYRSGADFGAAVSGIAGPGGGTEQKPVGTVWMALSCRKGEPVSWKVEFKGERVAIIQAAARLLIERLIDYGKRISVT